MSKSTKRPNLPAEDSPQFLRSVRETIQQLLGERGDEVDKAVTWRDLEREGIVEAAKREGTVPEDSERPRSDDGPGQGRVKVPPRALGLRAVAAFRSILVSWSLPQYANHATTRVYRATVNNFGKAQEVGGSPGQVYTDTVGTGATRYYWVRFVSTEGVQGPPSGPVAATTPTSPEQRLGEITDEIRRSDLYASLRAEVEIENLNRERTIKVGRTVDGQEVVGGIGLAVNGPDSDNPGTVDFGILANRLWVAAPDIDYSDEEKNFPFAIVTEDTEDGPVQKVYIDTAMIADASIDSAKIESLAAEKLVVGAGGAQIARALLAQAAITDAYFYNRLESGAVKTDENGDVIYEEDADGNLVAQFESLYSPGESGFRIDPQAGTAEFQDIVARGNVQMETGRIFDNVEIGPEGEEQFETFRQEVRETTDTVGVWKKPGTVKIDGNEIFAGDAYVDTLQIKNQAVTFPERFETGEYEWSYTGGINSFITLQTIPLEVTGLAPLAIFPSITFSARGCATSVLRLEVYNPDTGQVEAFVQTSATSSYNDSVGGCTSNSARVEQTLFVPPGDQRSVEIRLRAARGSGGTGDKSRTFEGEIIKFELKR